jgi:hypothetical protein
MPLDLAPKILQLVAECRGGLSNALVVELDAVDAEAAGIPPVLKISYRGVVNILERLPQSDRLKERGGPGFSEDQ